MPQVSVGVDPVKVQFQVPPWQRIRQFLVRKPPAHCVRAYPLLGRVDIPAENEGTVEAQFVLVNHCSRRIFPESISLNHWSWMSYALPELPMTVRGIPGEIRKDSPAPANPGR